MLIHLRYLLYVYLTKMNSSHFLVRSRVTFCSGQVLILILTSVWTTILKKLKPSTKDITNFSYQAGLQEQIMRKMQV